MADSEARKVIEIGYGGSERLTMNMGPQHPSAHGVFRAILTLEGETVVGVDAVIGYLHRCHEKLGETLTYVQYPSIASKTDYVAAMTAELAYVSAVELVGKIEVPRRAQWLRVLAAELQRVASHCLWLGTWCMDMGGALGGGATVFLYAIREREDILDLFEALTGARLLYGFHQPGGTRYDLPAGWAEQCRKTLDRVERRLDEYEAMLDDNAFFLVRTQGVGIISRELAQEIGVSGPLLRGSGVNHDLRKAAPYSSYEDFQFRVPVETAGDCFARYRVRMVEFRESITIARQVLDGLPEGPISSRPGVKSVGQVRVPKGEGYARVEGARGEVGCYLVSDGGPKPYRMKWRGASFSNLAVLPHIVPGHKIADVVAIMGSVDPVFGEADRYLHAERALRLRGGVHRAERGGGHGHLRGAARAQVRRAHAVAHRALPGRAARPAPAHRRRAQAHDEGRRRAPPGRPRRLQPGSHRLPRPVHADLRHPALRARAGGGGSQHRHPVLPRRLRHGDRGPLHGRVGLEQQVRAPLGHAGRQLDHLLRLALPFHGGRSRAAE